MSAETDFIEKIAPLVQKYAPKYGIKVCSPIIAQACLESSYGTSDKVWKNGEWRHNYFGLKWRNNRCAISNVYFNEITHEQKPDGSYIQIVSPFCKFKSMEDCVIGYFQWTNIKSYSNLKGVTDPQEYLENIKADKYATSIDYVKKNMNVVKKWNLTKYDNINSSKSVVDNKNEGEKKMSYLVAIDAGHGSQTGGKRTPDGYREHWINVKCAYYCEQFLNKVGVKTLRVAWNDTNATDDTDVALGTRQKQIKNAKCDYSISFHANAAGSGWGSANGVETLVTDKDSALKDSMKFAKAIQTRLLQGTKQRDRGVKRKALSMCNCSVMGTKASCLVEIGFMTNKAEADLMKTESFCKEQGEDAARGICDYLGISVTNVSTTPASQPTVVKPTTSTTTTTGTPKAPFTIKVLDDDLYIRSTPQYIANNSNVVGHIKDHGIYTIVQVSGSYGKLKSGKGWVSINQKYVKYQ